MIIRGIFASTNIIIKYYALQVLPLADVVMITSTSTVFTVFFARIFLREKIVPADLFECYPNRFRIGLHDSTRIHFRSEWSYLQRSTNTLYFIGVDNLFSFDRLKHGGHFKSPQRCSLVLHLHCLRLHWICHHTWIDMDKTRLLSTSICFRSIPDRINWAFDIWRTINFGFTDESRNSDFFCAT